MEEKKKRFRPSLTAYRELEKKVKELEQFKAGDVVPMEQFEELEKKVDVLESKNVTLAKSNEWADNELKTLRERNKTIEAENKSLKEEMAMLKSRGFWERVFNR